MRPRITSRQGRILDLDVETVAAGFGDPEWVPNRVTVISLSWIGEDTVHTRTILDFAKSLSSFLQQFFLGCPRLIEWFRGFYDKADIVSGHNLLRFDLPVINAECLRLGLSPLGEKMVQDTMHLPRAKGFKKGQDVMSAVWNLPAEKVSKNWGEWQRDYARAGWDEIKERCSKDILQHKQLRARQQELGLLTTKRWRP